MNDFPDPAADQLARGKSVSKLKSSVVLTATGVVLPQNLAEVSELAQYMCKAGSSIPVQMRDNPGECMGVIMDAMGWGMNPFAVARQCYVVESKDGNQTRAYMSQLITAIIMKFAPIQEKVIAPEYIGEGPARQCKISVHHEETGELMEYISPPIGEPIQGKAEDGSKVKSPGPGYVGIWPKNSPLWRTDPDQQLWYYTIRAWGRRFQPGILLGVYDIEEAHEIVRQMRDVTPKEKKNLLDDGDDAPAPTVTGEVIEPERRTQEFDRTAEAITYEPQVPLDLGEIDRVTVAAEPQPEDVIRQDKPIYETREDAAEAEDERIAEIERKKNQLPPERPSPERVYMNLVDSLRLCRTVKDYEAWRTENATPAKRKIIGDSNWKALGTIMAEVEDKVGYM